MAVTKDQFEIVDEQTVRHLPTGMKISTYRYKDPGDIGDLIVGGANSPKLSPEEANEVRLVALEMLKELQTKPQ